MHVVAFSLSLSLTDTRPYTHTYTHTYILLSIYLSICLSIHRLEDLVAQDDIVSILTKLIDNDNLPHLLFYGPPGTGKVRR